MNNNVLPSKQRNSSIELLRIISMVMIMFYHFSIHGHFDFATASVSVSRLWLNFISMGGKIGVDLFVLISGYYLISDTKSLNVIGKIHLIKSVKLNCEILKAQVRT